MPKYHPWRVVAMGGGVTLTAVDLIAVLTGLAAQKQPTYLIAGACLMTIAAGLLDPIGRAAWRHKHCVLAILLWVMIPVALYQVVTTAIERAGAGRDAIARAHQERADRIARATTDEAEAKAARDRAVALQDKFSLDAAAEAKRGGCKDICQSIEAKAQAYKAEAEAAQARLDAARATLDEVGPPTEDPLVTRMAASLPFSKETIATFHPMVLPVALPLLGVLLIDFALTVGGAPRVPTMRVPQKAKRPKPKTAAKSRRGRPPKQVDAPAADVVPLRARRTA